MKTNTEIGKILAHLNYRDEQVARFDNLALHLYTIPMEERYELIGALMWYCGVIDTNGKVIDKYKHHIDKFDAILAEINK